MKSTNARIEIIAALIIAASVMACVYYWVTLARDQESELSAAMARNETRVSQLNEAVTQQFEGSLQSVDQSIAFLRNVYVRDRGKFDAAVQEVLRSYPEGMLSLVVVISPQGYVSYSSGRQVKNLYMGDREHFRVHANSQEDTLFISKPVVGRINEVPLIPISRHIREGNKFLGVISIPLQPRYFAERFGALRVEPDDLLAIVRADGSFIARNHRLEEALKTTLPSDRPFLTAPLGTSGQFRDISTVDKKPMLFKWRRLSRWPVSVVVAVSETGELQKIHERHSRDSNRSAVAIAIVLLLSVGVAILLLRINRKNARLAVSEHRFRAFFEKNGSVMLLIEPGSGRIIDANTAASDFYGYARAQLLAKSIDAVNALPPAEVARERQLALREERNYFNFKHKLASGEMRDVEVYSTPIDAGEEKLLFSIVNDISARRLAEGRIQHLVEEQEAVLQSEVVGFVKTHGRLMTWMNKAYANMLGYQQKDIMGCSTRLHFVDDATFEAFGVAAYAAINAGELFRTSAQFKRKDDSLGWFELSAARLHHESDEVIWAVVDISERKKVEDERRAAELLLLQAQERLQASHDLLAHLSQNVPGVIYQFQMYPDGRSAFPYASDGIEDIYSVTPKDVMHDASLVFGRIHPDDYDLVGASIAESARTMRVWQLEYRVNLPLRGERWLGGVAKPTKLEDGSVLWHGFIKDVTERRLLEQAAAAQARDLNTILENSSVGISFVRERRQVWVNRRMAELLGYTVEEMQGQATRVFYPTQEAYEELGHRSSEVMCRGGRYIVEQPMLRKDGQRLWMRISGKLVDTSSENEGSIWIFEDITEQKRLESSLQLAASVFTHAREGILITDVDGHIVEVNETFTRITGYGRDEVIGKNPRILNSGRQGRDYYASMWKSLIEKGHWYGEVWNRRKNGEIYAELQTVSAVRDKEGLTQNYVALFSDITPMKEHERQLEHIAHYDALTHLPNRVLLADRIQQAMIQSQRRRHSLAVVFLDLDGFKAVNDTFGHTAGDSLLIELAQRIKASLREGDTLARIGGDEFVAILADLEHTKDCEPVLSRMLQAASEPVNIGDNRLQVSASMGVTLYPQDGADADLLLRHADQAMYAAKQAGKNRYQLFDVQQDSVARSRRESLERIAQALKGGELRVYYQPKVNMSTGGVVGVEALVRWQHPELGLLSPSDFLPVIEDHQISVDMGDWVINDVLGQMSMWKSSGLTLHVSVNVSARQLQQESFVPRLQQLLADHPDIEPAHLQLEVLESNALHDIHKVGEIMNACHAFGVSFALDDFGTGYSSLTYLKHLPAKTLKIDQSFVRDMLVDVNDLAIVNGVIGLARAFGREVIAEGVETAAHRDMLMATGCELAQGFGIARPMAAHEFSVWFENWKRKPKWVE